MLSELKIDGNAVTTASSYTFENVTSNHTITATFSRISYTISYNLDGGTVAGNPTNYTVEDAVTLVNPTKDGYNFTGWTGTGLTEATTTVTIAKGSTGDRTYTANWEVANIAPTTPTATLSSKTTNSFNVRAVSTDANGDSLIYKLYVDGSLKSTSASTQSGTATTFSVTGLGEYTSHNYYVTVSDGIDTAQSSTASVRTYCSGTGLTCNTTYCSSGLCSKCGGDGTYYESCISDNYAIVGSGGSNKCFFCNKTIYYSPNSSSPAYLCNLCDKFLCYECMEEGEHRYKVNCYDCTDGYACTHKLDYAHYKCNHYSYTTNKSHSYCSHGKTSQHD